MTVSGVAVTHPSTAEVAPTWLADPGACTSTASVIEANDWPAKTSCDSAA